jgi:Cu2+-exporting ATPase
VRQGATQAQAQAMAAALARGSLHPISKALVAAVVQPEASVWHVDGAMEVAGGGLAGWVWASDQRQTAAQLRLGSAEFCGIASAPSDFVQAHLSDSEGWLATFEFHEDVRSDALQAVAALQGAGLVVHLVSGDATRAVARVATQVGISDYQGNCSPLDKLEFLRHAQEQGRRVAVVGDGINDGPVLAGAHVSFAFGRAVPLAQAQADFVVLGEQVNAVVASFHMARRTLGVVRQNLWWAASYNAVCVPLAVLGWLPAWLAGLGMGLSSLLVVLNARRLALIPP